MTSEQTVSDVQTHQDQLPLDADHDCGIEVTDFDEEERLGVEDSGKSKFERV